MAEQELINALRYRKAEGDGVWVVLPPELIDAAVTVITMTRGQSPQIFHEAAISERRELYRWLAVNSALMEFTITVGEDGWGLANYTWTTIARTTRDKLVPEALWRLVDAWMESIEVVKVEATDHVPDLQCLCEAEGWRVVT